MEQNLKRKSNNRLDVGKVIADFQKAECSSSHRKGTFKIDKALEQALDTILKTKTSKKQSSKH
jgi:hypothetical protein